MNQELINYATKWLRHTFDSTENFIDSIAVIDDAIRFGLHEAAREMLSDLTICMHDREKPFLKMWFEKNSYDRPADIMLVVDADLKTFIYDSCCGRPALPSFADVIGYPNLQ